MRQFRERVPVPRTAPGALLKQRATARRYAGLLGFCLPLSGGLSLSQWLPGYPDQLSPIRLVTFVSLMWLVTAREVQPLPVESRRMIQAFLSVFAYATLSLAWTPDESHGLHDAITVGMALATGLALLLTVRSDRRALGAFAGGALMAGVLQVGIAASEILTGYHPFPAEFSSQLLESRAVPNVEAVLGAVAWGTMGNPNDLGGFWLLVTAVFLSVGAYGLRLHRGHLMLGCGTTAVAIGIGLTALGDARSYRLGLVFLIGMHLIDRLLTPGPAALRAPVMLLLGWAALALALLGGGSVLGRIRDTGGGDALRLELIADGFRSALLSGGFGRGLGAEKAMLDAGEIPTNLHNIVATLLAELGLIVAAAFLVYLLALILSWAFATRPSLAIGHQTALARASLAAALIFYGVTSSGVLESPIYWAFFAATAAITGLSKGAGSPPVPATVRSLADRSSASVQ